MSRLRILGVSVALAAALAACGSGEPAAAPPTSAPHTGTTITIRDFAFTPTPLGASVGDTITVRNADDTAHTLTADDGSVDVGALDAGATKTFTVDAAGDLAYHCRIHDYMKGVIRVTG